VVTIYTACFNTQTLCILPTQCICVFRMAITTNSDTFPKQTNPKNLLKGQSYHAVKTYGGTGDITLPFSTSALDGDEWSASRSGCFTTGDQLYRRLGAPPSPQTRCVCYGDEELLFLSGINPLPSGPCTDQAIPARRTFQTG
jgi:hypothetical protein